MKITVFGASGILGAHVVPRLLERGHAVVAVKTPTGREPTLTHPALRLQTGSILSVNDCTAALHGAEAVLHLATAIPTPGPAMDWSRNDEIRRAGTRNLIEAGQRQDVSRYVFQSVAMLASDASGRLLDESAPVVTSIATESARDLEAMVLAAPLDAAILRGGSFYGPGTGRQASLNAQAREGALQYFGDGGSFVSWIHVVDMARAVVAAVEQRANGVMNIVDDLPVTERVLFEHIARQVGGAAPVTGGRPIFPSFNLSNRKAREQLDWAPAYPSYLSGWVS